MAWVEPSDWRPLWLTFPEPYGGWLRGVVPRLEVDTARVRQQPTATDPLGLTPRITIEAQQDTLQVRLLVDGEPSPWLEPSVLQTWLVVERPDLFRLVHT